MSESKRSECSIGNNIEIIDVEESESDECVDYIKQKVVKNHLNIKHPKIHLTSDEGFQLKEQHIYLKKIYVNTYNRKVLNHTIISSLHQSHVNALYHLDLNKDQNTSIKQKTYLMKRKENTIELMWV